MAGNTGTIAVLAEKPSVARDIARVLGADKRGDGYLQGNGYVVTWAVGHLVSLAQPHEINPQWKQWRFDTLPILPERWPLVVYEKTKDQFEIIRKILTSERVAQVVCATDAGREGELIFRYIYDAAGCEKPFSRLWISSLTPDAIKRGFEKLRPGKEYDNLADAACGRSRADWLVGMNLSRAYSLLYNEDLSVGRVQTPTLAMVVDRELTLRNFVPEDYVEVLATFHPTEGPKEENYQGLWFRPQAEQEKAKVSTEGEKEKETQSTASRLPSDGVEAKEILDRAKTGDARIESIAYETKRMQPPLLYDLTELQRHANRLFSYSAQKTLDIAQALYERHKVISYPRTDSRYLSTDISTTVPRIASVIASRYKEMLAPGTGERALTKRYVDDSKVGDHHAIIPTAVSPDKVRLSEEERKIYDLVCRRLLMMWHDDHLQAVTTVITAITNNEIVDRYRTTGTVVQQAGWKILDLAAEGKKKDAKAKGEDKEAEQVLPSSLAQGQPQTVDKAEAKKKKTRPPKRFTEGTLLTAMETAGKSLEEKELSDAMKETGLGTPATRASIIEVLLKRGYIVRNGKTLEATEKGIHLIEVVHADVKSPIMTGQWEAFLKRIQYGDAHLDPFLDNISEYVRSVVTRVRQTPAKRQARSYPSEASAAQGSSTAIAAKVTAKPQAATTTAPLQRKELPVTASLTELLQKAFGFSAFRPNQEVVCQAVLDGKDALLVMPTGSGKSLCYQLPGVARGGTTLVISPLIALMDDQVQKLAEKGFAVDCIHSGRDRETSRRVCADYLHGRLQFLFVAPERFRVTGFPEMLAKRKPTLIAIDEAHCISQWGHDFRPDYRMLGQYLPSLRPAPILGLTATATPQVQEDIVTQLGLHAPERFIHGFRRNNISIEVVEAVPSQRPALAREILEGESRLPAILYAPTRKLTTSLAEELSLNFRTGSYHAGLDAEHRRRVQEQFMNGELDLIAATTAFGMGIDKANIRTVIHMALPASIEGYYQEIGRAGRDGKPSRAILMHSYGDRHTHDFLFKRDYPDIALLERLYAALTTAPQSKDVLAKALHLDEDTFERVLEKLWIHKGAVVDFAENISRGEAGWSESYLLQGTQKRAQIDQMIRFAEGNACRMSALVQHFGDVSDNGHACDICDFCAPEQCAAQRFRTATEQERSALFRILEKLKQGVSRSTGKLHSELYPGGGLSRDEFEEVLGAMARAGLLAILEESFEKDGKHIPYRSVRLTAEGEAFDSNTPVNFVMKDTMAHSKTRKKKKAATTRQASPQTQQEESQSRPEVEEALRAWRLKEAKRKKVPAFRIFSDKTLRMVAAACPQTDAEFLAISGIGMGTAEKYGAEIYQLIKKFL